MALVFAWDRRAFRPRLFGEGQRNAIYGGGRATGRKAGNPAAFFLCPKAERATIGVAAAV